MKQSYTLYRFYIALILLTSFASTQFPFELFHNHASTVVCSSSNENNGLCHHKSHVGNKEAFCWACTIHVEKNYTLSTPVLAYSYTQLPVFCNEAVVKKYTIPNTHVFLRGPPAQTIA
ncbi:MAG: hypothetical protein QM802_00240 [Agriterribacter sp.]